MNAKMDETMAKLAKKVVKRRDILNQILVSTMAILLAIRGSLMSNLLDCLFLNLEKSFLIAKTMSVSKKMISMVDKSTR